MESGSIMHGTWQVVYVVGHIDSFLDALMETGRVCTPWFSSCTVQVVSCKVSFVRKANGLVTQSVFGGCSLEHRRTSKASSPA